jgi:uncharacterized protein
MERHGKGFASMDPKRRRELARRGGLTAHRLGKAHKFTPEEAQQAGKKGGRTTSRDRAHMIEIGRKGGENSEKARKDRASAKNQPGQES